MAKSAINWHRLFGLGLVDYFHGSKYSVELERDLSLKRQLLDVIIIERKEKRGRNVELCDGFEDLGEHNLLTYKSKHESLNEDAVEELIGHRVNYHKILSSGTTKAEDIRLFAVSTSFPRKLAKTAGLAKVKDGVYNLKVMSRTVRVIVLSELPETEANALLNYYSFDREKVTFAHDHYHWRAENCLDVFNQLLEKYALEGLEMPYTMEQFHKDYMKSHIDLLDPEERLKGLDPQEVLKRIKPEDRLKGLDLEEIEKFLSKARGNKRRKTSRQGRKSRRGR